MSSTSPADVAFLLVLCLALAQLAHWTWFLRSTSILEPLRRPRERLSQDSDSPTPESEIPHSCPVRGRKKPEWIRLEVIRLKALNPDSVSGSCRKIAAMFNAMHPDVASVGKTWVATVLRDDKYEIEATRREIRSRKPPAGPRNRIWAIDITAVPIDGRTRLALGILDHGTRACIAFQAVESKHSWILFRELCSAIRQFGKPARVRTDNEAVFTSRLFQCAFWILGIRHERIEVLAPWQNGRIERFFGTFKQCWTLFRARTGAAVEDVRAELAAFRTWYNHVRPHMHLEGHVPADVWSRTPLRRDREHDYPCVLRSNPIDSLSEPSFH